MNRTIDPESAAVRFAGAMSYRVEGDVTHLEADLKVCDPVRAAHGDWALQFRTDDEGPGILIAELPLGSVAGACGAVIPVSGSAPSVLPAGGKDHRVALRLVREQGGDVEEHDFAAFSHPQDFLLPRLAGLVSYNFGGDNVEISVGRVENPRAPGNLSGTLSLELWALPVAYRGGDFHGSPVAGIQIGCLTGQQSWHDLSFTLPTVQLTPGEWHLTLMLREWSNGGFVTRDFTRFAKSYLVEAPVPGPAASKPAASKPAASKPAESKPAESKPAESKPAAAKAAKSTPAKPEPEAGGVSVNRASARELSAVKGISKSLAEAIVAARPFATLDELTRVKGVGDKLLARLRGAIGL